MTDKDFQFYRKLNEDWQIDFNKILLLRKEAKNLEKFGKFHEAILYYLESVNFGENSKLLNIYNYAFDIDRIIILYSKTKQINQLQDFLNSKIQMYPEFEGTKHWIKRLDKIIK